jgi:hypothetical protein
LQTSSGRFSLGWPPAAARAHQLFQSTAVFLRIGKEISKLVQHVRFQQAAGLVGAVEITSIAHVRLDRMASPGGLMFLLASAA